MARMQNPQASGPGVLQGWSGFFGKRLGEDVMGMWAEAGNVVQFSPTKVVVNGTLRPLPPRQNTKESDEGYRKRLIEWKNYMEGRA